jgi:dTMP kinase
MANGKLLVLDGLDGSGKSTQFALLQTALQQQGIDVQAVSFPDYDSPSASLVKMYLRGDFSHTPDGVNAYAASSFYAVDRYANYRLHWEQAYHNGTCILASRYTTSNAIYQMGKLPETEWDAYLDWLAAYEYHRLGLPEPDAVIYLDMPVSVQQQLLAKRYHGDLEKKDLHESDIAFQLQCQQAAYYAAEKLHWQVLPCSKDGEPLPVETIQAALLQQVQALWKGNASC